MKVKPNSQQQENPNLIYLTSQMSLSQEQIIGRRTGQLFLSNQDDPDLHINIKDVFPISNKKKNDISTEKKKYQLLFIMKVILLQVLIILVQLVKMKQKKLKKKKKMKLKIKKKKKI